MSKVKLTARAAILDRFGLEARARLRRLALDLAEGASRDDPRRAAMRPDEIESLLTRLQAEAAYIGAHHVAACEIRLLAGD